MGQAFGGGQGVGPPPPSKSIWVWPSISLAGIFMLKTEQTPRSVSVAIAMRSLIRLYLRGICSHKKWVGGGVFEFLLRVGCLVASAARVEIGDRVCHAEEGMAMRATGSESHLKTTVNDQSRNNCVGECPE